MNLLLQLLANALVDGALFALIACAFGLVYRSARVFHIAFAGLFLVGPYVAWAASARLGLPVALAVGIGTAAGAATSYAAELCLYRPFFRRKATAGAVMVASLGAFIIIENLMVLLFGNELRTFDRGVAPHLSLGPVSLTTIQVAQFAIAGATTAFMGLSVRHIRVFKALWAMGDEPLLMPVLGLPLNRYRSLMFSLSGALGGLAGCLIAVDVGVTPHMGMSYLLLAAVAVLAGGMDRISGWVGGGLALAAAQNLVVWKLAPQWMDLATFGILVGVLVFRPQGMLGLRRRLEES